MPRNTRYDDTELDALLDAHVSVQSAELPGLIAALREAREVLAKLETEGCCATDHARVCDKPGCNAAIVRLDNGNRVCANMHPTRWCEVSERAAAIARAEKAEAELRAWHDYDTAIAELRARAEKAERNNNAQAELFALISTALGLPPTTAPGDIIETCEARTDALGDGGLGSHAADLRELRAQTQRAEQAEAENDRLRDLSSCRLCADTPGLCSAHQPLTGQLQAERERAAAAEQRMALVAEVATYAAGMLDELDEEEGAAAVYLRIAEIRDLSATSTPPGEQVVDLVERLKRTPPETEEPDLDRCPGCNGPADQGHDRCLPPSPYYCIACQAKMDAETEEPSDG